MNAFRHETLSAIQVLRQALEATRQRTGAQEITNKGHLDIATGTDMAVEDLIRSEIEGSLGHSVIGEERGGDRPADGSAYWLVDPICGTLNFSRGIPLYCVNLALIEGDEVVSAAVGDASTDEILVAESGRGSWALSEEGWRRLAVDDTSQTIIVEPGGSTGKLRERASRCLAQSISARRWDIRLLSSSLSLPYVAAGRVAGYVLFFASAIHTAAGSLLAREAGAIVSDVDGAPWGIRSKSIIASANPSLHDELVELACS